MEAPKFLITPALNRYLLQPVKEDHAIYGNLSSKLILPGGKIAEDVQSQIFRIVASPSNALQFKVGDLVFITRSSVMGLIAHRGEKFIVVNEPDIVGTVSEVV